MPHSDEAVAFSAYSSVHRGYDTGDIVLFDIETTNIGGYYDSTTSILECPVHGVYLLALSGYKPYNEEEFQGVITKNGILFGEAAAFDASKVDQGATTVVLECNIGERVWVEARTPENLWGNPSIPFSVFTGVLLHSY